jgi:hypothetical protein
MGSKQKRLAKARKRKRQISAIFDALRHDRIAIEDVLRSTPECLGNVSIHVVMTHAHNLGPQGVEKCLRKADVWPTHRMRDIPQDAKLRVIENLPPRVRKYGIARN